MSPLLFIILNTFFFIVAVWGLVIIWWVWPPDSPWSPWWRTSRKKALDGARLADIKKEDVVYELGSGDANFLVAICNRYGCRGVGIEIDFLRHLTAKLNVKKNKVGKYVELKRGSFYDFKIDDATVIFCYLVPRVLEKLKPKFKKELARGTRIVSYRYKIQEDKDIKFVKEDKANEMYLYKVV